jgi:hypothetical protein
MKLELLNNGLHSIYHALQEIDNAELPTESSRDFDPDDHMIHWKDSLGNLSFYLEGYSKPPPAYGYKFAVLNLIQGLELILKSYLHEKANISIFKGNKGYTINLHEAVEKVVKINPSIFNPQEKLLIEASSDIRNKMQHYEFVYEVAEIKKLTSELYFLISKIVQLLFELNLYKHFEFNQWTESTDRIVNVINNLKHA